MISIFILAGCLTLGQGYEQKISEYNGVVTDINLGRTEYYDNKTRYSPSITVSVSKLDNLKLFFTKECDLDTKCVIDFLNVQNPVKLQYFKYSNTYVIIQPEPTEIRSETAGYYYGYFPYLMVGICICICICLCGCSNDKSTSNTNSPLSPQSNSDSEMPPLYTQSSEDVQLPLNNETTFIEPDTMENNNNMIDDDHDTISISSTTLLIPQ